VFETCRTGLTELGEGGGNSLLRHTNLRAKRGGTRTKVKSDQRVLLLSFLWSEKRGGVIFTSSPHWGGKEGVERRAQLFHFSWGGREKKKGKTYPYLFPSRKKRRRDSNGSLRKPHPNEKRGVSIIPLWHAMRKSNKERTRRLNAKILWEEKR